MSLPLLSVNYVVTGWPTTTLNLPPFAFSRPLSLPSPPSLLLSVDNVVAGSPRLELGRTRISSSGIWQFQHVVLPQRTPIRRSPGNAALQLKQLAKSARKNGLR